jgi:hypothetical protein
MTAPVARLAGDQCQVHRYHWPPVLETEVHHVQPLGMGGPDIPSNTVKVCGSGHANIHRVLHALAYGRQTPKSTRKERFYAARGFLAWQKAGRPGRIV